MNQNFNNTLNLNSQMAIVENTMSDDCQSDFPITRVIEEDDTDESPCEHLKTMTLAHHTYTNL